ncbi:MAG TPA: type II 3-dehydroquinate dehydratase [Longimicrobiales bacterium]|nr:type II 3-dehydroquinate dehydratase [Longimicrobiales bacterium]
MNIAILHGPNLNLLGRREPALYGHSTLAQIDEAVGRLAAELGIAVQMYQSNAEGDLIDYIHEVAARVDGFVVNAAGLTHTSVSLRDALTGVDRPFVEVHLSNPSAREPFRRESLLTDVATGVVAGFGADSYLLGLRGLVARITASDAAAGPGS